MKEPQDAGKYQVDDRGTVQGQVIGDHSKVELHFHGTEGKASTGCKVSKISNKCNIQTFSISVIG